MRKEFNGKSFDFMMMTTWTPYGGLRISTVIFRMKRMSIRVSLTLME